MTKAYHDLVILLSRGISQRNLYFEDHPRVQACAMEFIQGLVRQQDQDKKEKFFIGVANGKLIHDGKYLIGPTIIGSRLNSFADLLGCGGFLFNKGLTTGEMKMFFTMAAAQKTRISSLSEARQLLKSKNIFKVELSPPFEDSDWFGQFLFESNDEIKNEENSHHQLDEILPTFQSLYQSVETAHDAGHSGRSLDINQTRATSELLLKATEKHITDIMHLVKYPDYDTYTVGHSVRVAMFAVMVGNYLQLPKPTLNELGVAALLHDVGKSRIPAEILFKPGRLDPRERTIIEEHSILGAEMLMENKEASEMAIAAAWGHHRRYDKSGYPSMSYGSAESALTQIINVCDVFEALTAIRPYKEAHTPRRAYEIMLSDSGWFCPSALSAFCSAIGLYPAGSRVRLTNGNQAMVIKSSDEFDLPLVKTTHDINNMGLPKEAQLEIDLSASPHQVKVKEMLMV